MLIVLWSLFPQINTGLGQKMDEGLNVGQTERVSVISDSSRHLKFENTSDPSTIKFVHYENIDEGVRMEYPSDWNITEHPYYGGGITFTNMEGSSFDISSSLYKNASLDQIVNQTISSYKELYSNSNFTLLNASSNSSNNGWFQQQLPSAMLNYSYIDNYNYDIKNNTEIITIYNDKVYSILFSADEPRYERKFIRCKTDDRIIKNIFSDSL